MTVGVIRLLKENEVISVHPFKTRKEMRIKLTELSAEIKKLRFPFIYELSVILKQH